METFVGGLVEEEEEEEGAYRGEVEAFGRVIGAVRPSVSPVETSSTRILSILALRLL